MPGENRAIAVSLVEDNRAMREVFTELLTRTAGLRCAGVYASGEEAVMKMPKQTPDVALVDIHLPGINGIQCVTLLKEQLPDLQVLMLTRYEQSDLVFESLRGQELRRHLEDELVEVRRHLAPRLLGQGTRRRRDVCQAILHESVDRTQ